MNAENWRPIPMAPGYEASDHGRIKATHSGRGRRPGHIMAQHRKSGEPYLEVDLVIEGRRIKKAVHRLVADAFLGALPVGQQTRHLDGKGFNNRLENLQYGTAAENTGDAIEHGTHRSVLAKAKTHCAHGHEFTDTNTLVASDGHRACRRCDVAKSMRWQRRVQARREAAGEITPRVIREWARDNGFEVAETGRIHNEIKRAFAASLAKAA